MLSSLQIDEINKSLSAAFRLCELMDAGKLGDPSAKTKELLRTDLLKFCLYLCAGDRKVYPEEADFLRDFLGYQLDTKAVARLIKDSGVESETFAKTVPLTEKLFLAADACSWNNHPMVKNTGTETLITAFEQVGKGVLFCDNVPDPREKDLLISYIGMMRWKQKRYVEERRPS